MGLLKGAVITRQGMMKKILQCLPEKERLIEDTLRHFKMI